MIAIIDYGAGNLFSLQSSLGYLGMDTVVTGDENEIRKADRLILPGVGAFSDAIAKLRDTGLDKVIIEETAGGKPLLGICLGMQMLFEESHEFGIHKGLGLIPGKVRDISPVIGDGLKVPHIGWNGLVFPEGKEKSVLFKDIKDGEYVYFVHSYAAFECDEYASARTEYGKLLTASVENGNVYGTQFHPEKSGSTGLKILKAFCEL